MTNTTAEVATTASEEYDYEQLLEATQRNIAEALEASRRDIAEALCEFSLQPH